MVTVVKIGRDTWSVDAEGFALLFNKSTGGFERAKCPTVTVLPPERDGEPCDTLLRVDEDGINCPTCGYFPEELGNGVTEGERRLIEPENEEALKLAERKAEVGEDLCHLCDNPVDSLGRFTDAQGRIFCSQFCFNLGSRS